VFTTDPGEGQEQAAFLSKIGSSKCPSIFYGSSNYLSTCRYLSFCLFPEVSKFFFKGSSLYLLLCLKTVSKLF
jgi:hypothetical protein